MVTSVKDRFSSLCNDSRMEMLCNSCDCIDSVDVAEGGRICVKYVLGLPSCQVNMILQVRIFPEKKCGKSFSRYLFDEDFIQALRF